MCLDVMQGGALGAGNGRQGPHLNHYHVIDLLGGDRHHPAAKAGQIRQARVGSQLDAML